MMQLRNYNELCYNAMKTDLSMLAIKQNIKSQQ